MTSTPSPAHTATRDEAQAAKQTPTHTPAPWRWEINLASKSVQLVGGVPRYDLTVMDFVRYGMGGAAPRFVMPHKPGSGFMIMQRADEFTAIVAGREHHEHWFRTIDHPDARLIAAAPELLAACKFALENVAAAHQADPDNQDIRHTYDCLRAAISSATGASL